MLSTNVEYEIAPLPSDQTAIAPPRPPVLPVNVLLTTSTVPLAWMPPPLITAELPENVDRSIERGPEDLDAAADVADVAEDRAVRQDESRRGRVDGDGAAAGEPAVAVGDRRCH